MQISAITSRQPRLVRSNCLTRLSLVFGLALTMLGVIAVGLGQARSFATTYAVTNTNDAGPGSLRQALAEANANAGADVINITANGAVDLLSVLPTITGPVTIQGPGASLFKVDGQGLYRVFDIGSVAVTLSDLTIQRGAVTGASEDGAGIRSSGVLTLVNVNVLSNTVADDGGGVYAAGSVTLINSLFQNNLSTAGNGGGLFSNDASSIRDTRFVSNTARADGGAVFALVALTVTNGLFQDNRCTATSCDGGGLFVFSQADIIATQFVSNTAQDQGGGAATPGVARMTNGLFQNNHSAFGTGGGLFAQSAAELSGVQFIGNTARSNGGGMYALGAVTITQGLFQDNHSALGAGGGLAVTGPMALNGAQFLRNEAQQGGGLYHTLDDGRLINSLFAGNGPTNSVGAAMLLASPGNVDVVHLTIAAANFSSGSAIQVLTGTVGITNTVIASHTIGISNTGGAVTEDYNLFFANGLNSQGLISGGSNSISGDPAFVDAPGNNYHLSAGSAAINSGTDAGVTTDFDGEPRPQAGGFDIGYDEANIITGLKHLYLPLIFRE